MFERDLLEKCTFTSLLIIYIDDYGGDGRGEVLFFGLCTLGVWRK